MRDVSADGLRIRPPSSTLRGPHRTTDEFPRAPSFQEQNIGHPTDSKGGGTVDWTLELVVVPVADVDRAKTFYMERAGFGLDVDFSAGDDFRVVQLSPPGSACAIALMKNSEMAPGSLHGLHLCVSDLDAARAQLVEHGVDASEMFHFAEGGQVSGPDPERQSYNSFLSFHDPDGNTWLVQEVKRTKAEA
jgi:predicted enzyme related to lactoylglutathione lyase